MRHQVCNATRSASFLAGDLVSRVLRWLMLGLEGHQLGSETAVSAQAAYQAALAQQLVGPPLAPGGAGPYGPMGLGYGGPQGALAAQVAAQLAMQQGYYPGPNINAAAAAAAAAAVQNMMGARLLLGIELRFFLLALSMLLFCCIEAYHQCCS